MLANLETLRPLRHLLPFRLPDEIADRFVDLLREWRDHAERCGPTFVWSGDLDEDDVRTLVRYWANLDSLSDDTLDDLGLSWSPPDARPFFDALAHATAAALAAEEGGADQFAELLVAHAGRDRRCPTAG